MSDGRQSTLRIGKKAFFLAFTILLILMTVSGVLTRTVPAGEYEREIRDGREFVVPGSYQRVQVAEVPVWRWFVAPVEVLFAPGNITVITIILFLVFVGGSFTILEMGEILQSLLGVIVSRFRARKYLLLAAVLFFFMAVAAVLGIYEAMVPLIVFIVPMAHYFGWDSMVGLGLSLLPLAFGFSAAITNPFTIGVAQQIAELPLFSGAWLRMIFFVVVYASVTAFVMRYAKRVEADPSSSVVWEEDRLVRERYARQAASLDARVSFTRPLRRAVLWFAACLGLAFAFAFATARIPAVSDYAFPLMALLFLIGGVGSGLFAGMGGRAVSSAFAKGATQMLPGVVLILMSMSVKYIVESGGIMDTILHAAARVISQAQPLVAAFLVYVVTLIMNFFVGSASAKAFLMMPILTPLADLVGITRQTAVFAFDLGDGFSNMLYPSNALLLIGLSFTVVSYPKWIRWTIGLQAVIFLVSMLFLGFAVVIGFGPF
jgi:uncharacterized ion transporter superfamily protein YfcC